MTEGAEELYQAFLNWDYSVVMKTELHFLRNGGDDLVLTLGCDITENQFKFRNGDRALNVQSPPRSFSVYHHSQTDQYNIQSGTLASADVELEAVDVQQRVSE